MTPSAIQKPTLAAELFGGDVGFSLGCVLRWVPGTVLVGAALLLVARRAAGALEAPPTLGTALSVALAVVCLAALHRTALRHFERPAISLFGGVSAASEAVVWYLPTAALVLIGSALSMPGTSLPSLAFLWLALLAGEAAWFRVRSMRASERSAAVIAPKLAAAMAEAESAELEAVEPDESHVSQSWKRSVDTSGSDVLEGYARARFEVGSRQASIHLVFCPPFERIPVLETETLDDLEARLIHITVLPYAARIDVRLSEPAEEELRATIGIRAVCDAGSTGTRSSTVSDSVVSERT
ncbi:MAG: hypothetical protein K8U03_04220 [Planctomycetia bacterium]|nr:hypothetical protein [Planctomycetia bacterium]